MHTVLEIETVGLNLIPRKKLCPSCRSKVMKHLSKSMSENDKDFDIVSETSIQNKKEGVNTHFTVAGISPIRVKGLHSQCWVSDVHIISKVEVPTTKTGLCYY